MESWLAPYSPLILALGATGVLSIVQLLVADVAGVVGGKVPGTPVEARHDLFLFRATRAHENTNETIGVFVLAALFGVLSRANPGWINSLAWTWVGARAAHTIFYWADLRLPRSGAFVVGLLALVGMLIVGFVGGQ